MSIEAAFFGVLGRDAEEKTSKAGKPYLRLNVRVGDGNGAQWISVMCFDDKAFEVADEMLKGARVYVEGSLRLDQWEQQDGTKRTGLSVMSWHSRLAAIGRNRPPKKLKVSVAGGTAEHSAAARAPANDFYNDEIPF
jgi:single-stranded DNA-binding protein